MRFMLCGVCRNVEIVYTLGFELNLFTLVEDANCTFISIEFLGVVTYKLSFSLRDI